LAGATPQRLLRVPAVEVDDVDREDIGMHRDDLVGHFRQCGAPVVDDGSQAPARRDKHGQEAAGVFGVEPRSLVRIICRHEGRR